MPVKRISEVYDAAVSMDNLRSATRIACRNRKNKREVAEFKKDGGALLERLRESILDGTYRSSEYKMLVKNENGKERYVADLPLYPDRIWHQAICNVLEGPLNSKLIDQTYAAIPGTGQHHAVRKMSEYLRNNPRLRYALVIDIRKFFQSIDREILKRKLAEAVKDCRMLEVLYGLIDDYPYQGIALGTRFSPMFANLYLSEMDHALKERYHVHYMARFMDDIAILGFSKQWLRKILDAVRGMLAEIGLEIKANWQIFPVDSRGIPYLGYRIFSDHILLKKRTKKRMQKAVARLAMLQTDPDFLLDEHDLGTLNSYRGCLKWCSGKHLESVTIAPVMEEDARRQKAMEN
jgi:hypothetical protein